MTITRTASLMYVGSRTSRHRAGHGQGIELFGVAPDGTWHHVRTAAVSNPTYLALSPSGRLLYSTEGDGDTVRVHRIGVDGELDPVDQVDCGGSNPVHLALSADHRHLLVANHNSGTVAALPIHDDDALGSPAGVIELSGEPGPHRHVQDGAKPHQVVVDPGGRFLIVPDKGLDSLFVLEITPQGGLTTEPGRTVRLREMSGPRHVALHPGGKHAYSVEELRSTVTRYDWDGTCGTLAPRQVLGTLPEDMTGDSRAAEIAVHPDGHTVYASNRGGPGDHSPGGLFPDSLVSYRVAADGRLHTPEWTTLLGIRPRYFRLADDARHILVAHERSDTVAEHELAPDGRVRGPGRIVARSGSPVALLPHTLHLEDRAR